jgi:hypothetical protein
MNRHTATPWEISGGALRIFGRSIGGGCEWVATVEGATPENGLSPTPPLALANAQHIIRCVNERDDLLDQRDQLVAALQAFLRAPAIESGRPGSVSIEVQTFNLNTARAVLTRIGA